MSKACVLDSPLKACQPPADPREANCIILLYLPIGIYYRTRRQEPQQRYRLPSRPRRWEPLRSQFALIQSALPQPARPFTPDFKLARSLPLHSSEQFQLPRHEFQIWTLRISDLHLAYIDEALISKPSAFRVSDFFTLSQIFYQV